ncbi:hypothetical protein BVRB_8g184030 [Beta vulgaris subsp. vulgaris]|nr:hypothetical protein BVRB_8g184030 [Beta vulgaris subsp. vulgaris]
MEEQIGRIEQQFIFSLYSSVPRAPLSHSTSSSAVWSPVLRRVAESNRISAMALPTARAQPSFSSVLRDEPEQKV